MAVKLLNNFPSQNTPNIFVYRVALILPRSSTRTFLYTLVYKSSIPTLTHFLEWLHHWTMTFGWAGKLSSHAYRHQPVGCQRRTIGSVMDFGPWAGDWTLKLSTMSYNWNYVPCVFPYLRTWHSQTMMNSFTSYPLSPANFTCKKNYTPVLLWQLVWCSWSLPEAVEAT